MANPNHYNAEMINDLSSRLLSTDAHIQELAYTEFEDKILYWKRGPGAFQEPIEVLKVFEDDSLLILIPTLFEVFNTDSLILKRKLAHKLSLIADYIIYARFEPSHELFDKTWQVRQQIWLHFPVIKQGLNSDDKILQRYFVRLT
ncbi:MAG: hypothetical protein AAFV98_20970, partial [Chloroflexota bacterium]